MLHLLFDSAAVDFLPYNRDTSIADNTAGMIMGKETARGELLVVDADTVLVCRGYTTAIVANGEQTGQAVSVFEALADRYRKDGVGVVTVNSGGNSLVEFSIFL